MRRTKLLFTTIILEDYYIKNLPCYIYFDYPFYPFYNVRNSINTLPV